jgi:hypothetical protein
VKTRRPLKPISTGVYLYVPATFDPTSFPAVDGLHDEACWLLHKVITTAIRHKHNPWHDGFAHISRQTMERFIHPSDVEAVRRCLIDNKIIVVNESYRISEPGIKG